MHEIKLRHRFMRTKSGFDVALGIGFVKPPIK